MGGLKNGKIVTAILVVAVSFLSGAAGLIMGGVFSNWRNENSKQVNSDTIISKLEFLKVGEQFPDVYLESLTGDSIMLSSLVADRTDIVFISPFCEDCKSQLAEIRSLNVSANSATSIIIITPYNPRLLSDLMKDANLDITALYDHRARLTKRIQIADFPFHCVVTRDMTLVDLFAAELTYQEMKSMLQ